MALESGAARRDVAIYSDQAALLTIIALMLYVDRAWFVRIPITMLAIVGVLSAPLRGRTEYWYFVTIVIVTGIITNWANADNHYFLMAYWSLAIMISTRTPCPAATRAHMARLLIAGCFSLAVIQKIFSQEFMSGDFLYFSVLLDSRFDLVGRALFGTQGWGEVAAHNAMAMASMQSAALPAMLAAPQGLANIAAPASWFLLSLEVATAAAFLVPRRGIRRDVMLISFALLTYFIAPVLGFALILLAMGLAQTDGDERIRIAYLLTAVLIHIGIAPI